MKVTIWSHYLTAVIEQLKEQNLLDEKPECTVSRELRTELIIQFRDDKFYNTYMGWGSAAIGCGFIYGFVVRSRD